MKRPDTLSADALGYGSPACITRCDSYLPTMLPRVQLGNGKPKKACEVRIIDSNVCVANDGKPYEPYAYCTTKKPLSYYDSMLHFLKASIGTGVLALPNAFRESGYAVGVAGVVFISVFFAACVHLLVAAEYELCKRRRVPNMSYATVVHAAFTEGPPPLRWLAESGKFLANFFFVTYESGGCAIYIIFIASNLKQVIDFHYGTDVELRALMTYIMLPIVLLCWVPNLKILSPLSAFANCITVVCFVLVFWYVFREPVTLQHCHAAGDVVQLPQFLATVLFAVACTGIVLPLKSEMRTPKTLTAPFGVLNVSLVPIAVLYSVFGFFGYLKYGDQVQGSITLNLPRDELLAQCIKGLYSLSVFISYFLCYYVVYDIVWRNYLSARFQKNKIVWEYVVRTAIPACTFCMAHAIPNLETFISLVGAFGISTTSLVIPIIVHTLVFWDTFEDTSEFLLFAAKNLILLLISTFIFVTSVAESVGSVIRLWNS